MLFNTSWIACFGVLCFSISEIAGVPAAVICFNDTEFKKQIGNRKSENVPVLITNVGLDAADHNIISHINQNIYPAYLKVVVTVDQCKVTDSYFPSGQQYPALFMVRSDHLFPEAFHWSNQTALNEFLARALNYEPETGETGVTEMINRGIRDRANAQLARAAARASEDDDDTSYSRHVATEGSSTGDNNY